MAGPGHGHAPRLRPGPGPGPRLRPGPGHGPRLSPGPGPGPRLRPGPGHGPRLRPGPGHGPRLSPGPGPGPRLRPGPRLSPRPVPGPSLSGGRPALRPQRRCPAGDCHPRTLHTKYESRSSLVDKGDMDSYSLESEFTESGRENGIRSSSDFLKCFKDWDGFDDDQDSFCDSSGLEIEEKAVTCSETDAIQNKAVYMKTGHTLPSCLAANTQEYSDKIIGSGLLKKIVSGTAPQACNSHGLIPPHISQIYDELFVIHQKLQIESSAQQEYALQLQNRERCLTERETLLFKHEAALAKVRGVEEEVHTKFGVIKQQHEAEVKQLTEALKEITKENRRLKSSFDTLKEMNDSLRKQLSDITELNKKLEGQARKVQARLENLQRKHEFSVVRKPNNICQVMQQSKPVKQEKVMATSKIAKFHLLASALVLACQHLSTGKDFFQIDVNCEMRKRFLPTLRASEIQIVSAVTVLSEEENSYLKLPLNSQVYELLTFLMDWISDEHLSKIKIEEEREDNHKLVVAQSSNKPCIRQKCMKLLPIATEQLQWMPYVNSKLHMPVIKFIYWSIRQLDTDIQHATMRSTMRRLGEDIFKGIVTKANPHGFSEQSTESKSKSAAFFKSSCMPLRFLSTLIVLKTVTQVDYLAQAFDSLRVDLKTDEGKALFLEYQCVPVVLSHLKVSSRGLLSSALDGLLHMTMESGKFGSFTSRIWESPDTTISMVNGEGLKDSLQPFLEACSNESFFQTCSVLLRSSKLGVPVLEKLCVILQKLSRIKSNKKMFELFGLHQMIQELHRTTNPDHTFLFINLNSILLNLGLLRSNSLASSLSISH